jgi:hypothetical protein
MLETRLKAEHRPALQSALAEIDAHMVEIGELYVAEVARVKAQLLGDSTRTVQIRVQPRESDPNYPLLQQARSEVEGKGLGVVWGDVDKKTHGETHFIIRWEEWPGLRQIVDSQVFYVDARAEIVRKGVSLDSGMSRGPREGVPHGFPSV